MTLWSLALTEALGQAVLDPSAISLPCPKCSATSSPCPCCGGRGALPMSHLTVCATCTAAISARQVGAAVLSNLPPARDRARGPNLAPGTAAVTGRPVCAFRRCGHPGAQPPAKGERP